MGKNDLKNAFVETADILQILGGRQQQYAEASFDRLYCKVFCVV